MAVKIKFKRFAFGGRSLHHDTKDSKDKKYKVSAVKFQPRGETNFKERIRSCYKTLCTYFSVVVVIVSVKR